MSEPDSVAVAGRHRLVLGLALLTVLGCGDGSPADASPYASKELWLCRPDIENDRCAQADLSFTEIRPDGTSVTGDVARDPGTSVDCFYAYHTVDWRDEAGNTETLVPHPDEVVRALHRNGALYRGVCRMFAPLYRQMTLGTYGDFLFGGLQESEFFRTAYSDIVEAFEYYMRRHNAGRPLVLIGHSQGSQMLIQLLQEKFDGDEGLRAQLVSALLIGGGVEVRQDDRVGGSFSNIPLCASRTQTGCVVAFEAIAAGTDPPIALLSPLAQLACVNPASFDEGPAALSALIYSRGYDHVIPFAEGVDTEWVRYPRIYESRCSGGEGFRNVLEVDCASGQTCDVPMTPQEMQESVAENWGLSALHLVEYFIANADLVRIVEQQIASRRDPGTPKANLGDRVQVVEIEGDGP